MQKRKKAKKKATEEKSKEKSKRAKKPPLQKRKKPLLRNVPHYASPIVKRSRSEKKQKRKQAEAKKKAKAKKTKKNKKQPPNINTFRSSVLAGICIGIAGFGYLAEKSIIGAVLFAFGLLTVVHYGLRLYTGTAGFIKKNEGGRLLFILFGNIVGCLLVALIGRCSPMPLQDTAQKILEGRLTVGPLKGGILAIGCGFIMTTAVTFARKGQNLPLLFGVPLFIMCGFPHCVADA